MLDIPKFKTKKELFTFLVENKDMLITEKKSEFKMADGIGMSVTIMKSPNAIKSGTEELDKDEITVKVAINTTNIFDSHKDVHMPGLWKKSIKENKRIMHIQEHQVSKFDKIISSGEDLKVSTKNYTWKELGYDAEGKTEALVFDSTVKRERNPFMFEQYSKGRVDNHSVGMRYVKLSLAVNDKDYEEEHKEWKDNIDKVINFKEAEANGYMWLIHEAKVLEGSAVPFGSNPITPTINTKSEVVELTEEELKEKSLKQWLGIKDNEE